MATSSYQWSWLLLAAVGGLVSAAGCGESFVAETGSAGGGSGGTPTTGPAAGGGGSGGTGASGGMGGSGGCPDGLTEECYSGDAGTKDVGLCKHGTSQCNNGVWGESDEVLPATEVCDGADNDCNGQIDEVCSCTDDTSQPCYGGPLGTQGKGICMGGTQTCSGGSWGECKGEVLPGTESCGNPGADDDCNGKVDDLGNCDTGLGGDCGFGAYHCNNGTLVCEPANLSEEVCDGADNDCNGKSDDIQAVFCTIGGCAGTKQCVSGSEACVPTPTSTPEMCDDGIDNNCDGVTDPPVASFFGDSFNEPQNFNWTTDVEWAIGPAAVGVAAPPDFFPDPAVDATSLSVDNRLAGVVIGGNASTLPHPPRYLTSKVLSLANAPSSVVLVFKRWLNSDAAPKMTSTVEVFDGTDWVGIWQNSAAGVDGFPVADSEWLRQAYDVTPFKNPNFQIRFGVAVGEGDPPLAVGSWSVDDVGLLSCVPMP